MEIIVDAIAQSIKAHTLLDPVRQLEEEREQLIQEKEKLEEMVIRKARVRELARIITREVYNFEHLCESAPPLEKKRWLRRVRAWPPHRLEQEPCPLLHDEYSDGEPSCGDCFTTTGIFNQCCTRGPEPSCCHNLFLEGLRNGTGFEPMRSSRTTARQRETGGDISETTSYTDRRYH